MPLNNWLNKQMFKKISLFLFFCILSGAVFCQNILIVSSHEVPFFADTVAGIKEQIASSGSTASVDVRYSDEGDIVAAAGEKKRDVICVLGSSDAKKIIAKFKDVPIVFSLVMDPVKSGLTASMEATGKNITGVSLRLPADKQLEIVRKILPRARKIGLIYANASEEAYNSLKQLDTEVKGSKVSAATQVPSVLSSLGSVDAIWLVVDYKVYDKDSMEFTLKYCMDKKIPAIGFAANTVKAGALVGFVYDYRDLGRQTGEVVAEIVNGKNPGEIPIVVPRKVGYALNKRIARYLSINLSPDMINSAMETFE